MAIHFIPFIFLYEVNQGQGRQVGFSLSTTLIVFVILMTHELKGHREIDEYLLNSNTSKTFGSQGHIFSSPILRFNIFAFSLRVNFVEVLKMLFVLFDRMKKL